MLTSIATIAATLGALIGVGMKIFNSIKASQEAKNIELGRTIEQKIKEAKTNEEREALARDLNDHK